jgi:hypothetical protein
MCTPSRLKIKAGRRRRSHVHVTTLITRLNAVTRTASFRLCNTAVLGAIKNADTSALGADKNSTPRR